MCVYSMVVDDFNRKWPMIPKQPWDSYPSLPPPAVPMPGIDYFPMKPAPYAGPTKEQFDQLIDLLKAAKKIDIATGQPDCEIESKKKILQDMADQLGIKIELP